MNAPRLALVGTVQSSRAALGALVASGFTPALVVTLPPEAAARHADFVDLVPAAVSVGAAIHLTRDVNDAGTVAAITAAGVDLCLVVGWSQICHEPFRRAALHGVIGFHPAPLPRMRGRAVIPWTILEGETETGATLFWLDEGIDSGDIAVQERFAVQPDATARTLYDLHLDALARMLPVVVRSIADGAAPRRPQDHAQATWCARRGPEDGAIDWGVPAEAVLRLVRAVGDPYPGAFTEDGNGRIEVLQARLPSDADRYIGLVGQVQAHTSGGFLVRCGDGLCIEATSWRSTTGRRPKLHARLGRRTA